MVASQEGLCSKEIIVSVFIMTNTGWYLFSSSAHRWLYTDNKLEKVLSEDSGIFIIYSSIYQRSLLIRYKNNIFISSPPNCLHCEYK
jgi:hypothetical protein